MLKYDQIEKLEIAEKWLEEILESEEFALLDIYPDVTLGDSLQGIQEVLKDHYPCEYVPPRFTDEQKPVKTWRRRVIDGLSNIAITSLLTAAVSAGVSIFFWGVSDLDKAVGNKLRPDFAAISLGYRGMAIAGLGIFVTLGVAVSVVASKGE